MTVDRHGAAPHQDKGSGDRDDGRQGPLVSVRAALIIFMSLLAATGVGGATYLLTESVLQAGLAGGAAGWASLTGLHGLVARR
jgi:hypothetical protein